MDAMKIMSYRLSREIDKEILISVFKDSGISDEEIEESVSKWDENTENDIQRMLIGSNRDIHVYL